MRPYQSLMLTPINITPTADILIVTESKSYFSLRLVIHEKMLENHILWIKISHQRLE